MVMDKLENKKLAIIGMGHMGRSLEKGFLNSGFPRRNIVVSNSSEDNRKVAKQAEWIILAVKPSIIQQVVEDINDCIESKLLISVAAAVNISNIQRYTKSKRQKIIRIMPNLPIAYNKGVIGLFANKFVSRTEKKDVVKVLSVLGTVIEVNNEHKVDSLTLISACGPAIVSYFINLLSKTALSLGLSKSISDEVALETFIGTLVYLQKTGLTASTLQKAVATKGGVTEEIINSMNKNKINSLFQKSIHAGEIKIRNIRS